MAIQSANRIKCVLLQSYKPNQVTQAKYMEYLYDQAFKDKILDKNAETTDLLCTKRVITPLSVCGNPVSGFNFFNKPILIYNCHGRHLSLDLDLTFSSLDFNGKQL